MNSMVVLAVEEAVEWVGGEEEIDCFVHEGYPVLVSALALICGSRPAAEEAVQEALARAVLAQRRGRSFDSVAAWVRVVALNLLRNRWRSLLRERAALRRAGDDLKAASSEAIGREAALDLYKAIAALPRRQREAVALHYLLDLPVVGTAELMGVTEGTVKTLLSRARRALGAALGDEEPCA